MGLLQELDEQSSQIRFDVIDFSVGELIRLHEGKEIAIQPEFQRMFRWTGAQQSRFIESMLLGLPIPQIVLFQRQDGVLELIDGLQRVSSLIKFVTGTSPAPNNSEDDYTGPLIGCDILSSLNGETFLTLASVLQLELKRKTLRAIVIKRTNNAYLRYEMFKRLNSGGSPAEAHEIRNASLRIVGQAGENFLALLQRCSDFPPFQDATDSLSDQSKDRLGRQELVLRFLALKLSIDTYKGSISDWLDKYSEAVVKNQVAFDFQSEEGQFQYAFAVFAEKFGAEAFVKHKNSRTLGGLAPAYFDAVTMGLLPLLPRLASTSPERAKEVLNLAVGHENAAFKENVGPGANAVPRLKKRIAEVYRVFDLELDK